MGIRTKYFALRSFFLTLTEMDKLEKNPIRIIPKPKEHQNICTVVSYEDMYKLREVTKNNVRERTIIELLWCSGVRVEELCNMKMCDISKDRSIFLPKTKEYKSRSVLISPFCKEWLEDYKEQRNGLSTYLFYNKLNDKLTTQSIRNIIAKNREIAGIDKNISPHSFRRSFASILFKNGVQIQYIARLMGHISIKTTYRYAIYAEFL